MFENQSKLRISFKFFLHQGLRSRERCVIFQWKRLKLLKHLLKAEGSLRFFNGSEVLKLEPTFYREMSSSRELCRSLTRLSGEVEASVKFFFFFFFLSFHFRVEVDFERGFQDVSRSFLSIKNWFHYFDLFRFLGWRYQELLPDFKERGAPPLFILVPSVNLSSQETYNLSRSETCLAQTWKKLEECFWSEKCKGAPLETPVTSDSFYWFLGDAIQLSWFVIDTAIAQIAQAEKNIFFRFAKASRH